MDIYKDIIKSLYEMDFDVIWIEANTIPNNPYNKTLGLYTLDNLDAYMSKASEKWMKLLREDTFKNPIDYFISIVGVDIPPYVFEEISRISPNIRKVLYMHDRVEGVYQINEFFRYYDEVFSFDISDCNLFNLTFLPIYWIPISDHNPKILYDIFAFASYSRYKPNRTKLFKKIKSFSKKKHLGAFIKLYDKSYSQNRIKYIFKVIIKSLFKKDQLTIVDILNGLITGTSASPDKYRQLISSSNVVFDTQAEYQDGLTARFMWALGAGKKIITTNPHAVKYDFYNDNQILIINENINSSMKEIENFIQISYIPDPYQLKKIEPYRIDNWVKKLLKS